MAVATNGWRRPVSDRRTDGVLTIVLRTIWAADGHAVLLPQVGHRCGFYWLRLPAMPLPQPRSELGDLRIVEVVAEAGHVLHAGQAGKIVLGQSVEDRDDQVVRVAVVH